MERNNKAPWPHGMVAGPHEERRYSMFNLNKCLPSVFPDAENDPKGREGMVHTYPYGYQLNPTPIS